ASRTNAVGEDQPARLGFDRRSTVADLNQFPWKNRFEKNFGLIPETNMVREHEINILRVLPGQHGIGAIDLPGEKSHPFVLDRWTVQSHELKKKEVGRLQQLRNAELPVKSCEGGIVGGGSVVVLESHEAGILDAVSLRAGHGENDSLGQALLRRELDRVIGLGQHGDSLQRVLAGLFTIRRRTFL